MGLTHLNLQNAAPGEKPYKLYDTAGLYVIVAPSGSKLWRYDYRQNGKRKTAALGAWPAVSLAAARQRRDEMREAPPPAAAPPADFQSVARRWFDSKSTRLVSSYSTRIWNRLAEDIFPVIGDRPISEIEPPELLRAIRRIEDRGAIELAKRIKNHCGEVFRFAIAEGLCQRDPSRDIAAALKPRPRVVHRAAVKMAQMPDMVAAIDRWQEDTLSVQALKLTLMTVVRTNEIRFAQWSEFDGDVWRIPAERMKTPFDHIVPLSRQAVRLLDEIPRRGPMLFGADTRSGVISENGMLSVLYRTGYSSKMTVHGIRRVFSTHANETGLWRSDVIERTLAHVEANEVRGAYNAAMYLDERRKLLQWWSDLLYPDFSDLLG